MNRILKIILIILIFLALLECTSKNREKFSETICSEINYQKIIESDKNLKNGLDALKKVANNCKSNVNCKWSGTKCINKDDKIDNSENLLIPLVLVTPRLQELQGPFVPPLRANFII